MRYSGVATEREVPRKWAAMSAAVTGDELLARLASSCRTARSLCESDWITITPLSNSLRCIGSPSCFKAAAA